MASLALLAAGAPATAASPAPDGAARLALLLDTSGSLRPADVAQREVLARAVLEALPRGSSVAVLAFDDAPRLVLPLTADLEAARAAVSGIGTGGHFTALNDAVFDAVAQLRGPGPAAVLVLTDGVDENSAVALDDAVASARAAGLPVCAAGVGRVRDRALRRLAKLTGGEYFAPGTTGAAVAERLLAVAATARPPAPVPVPATAATAEAAVPATPTPGAAPARRPSRARWAAVGLGSLVGFAALVGAAALLLRRARVPAPAGPGREEAPSPDETLVTRRESGDGGSTPTLVLSLRPLLHVTRGPGTGRVFPVSTQTATSIGRARENDVVLSDPTISSQHCRIRPAPGGGFEVFDLGSTNGTFVNERPVRRQAVGLGDAIKVGETVLQFRLDHSHERA